ncbi:MAG: coproporphyrinogen dehydrogenase HemZ [Quinella sp. 1Q7]|nr:coproporphyrinogen dehydrogenase HemZ [Quinella sp. 1Q7]
MGITIKNLTLLGKNDFAKVVGDVLRALKVTVANREAAANFDDMEIFNEIVGRKVITRLKVTGGGMQGCLRKFSVARADERFGAEANRLVKKNLYRLLVDNFGIDAVPYGILHGVRPTKIIQRWIDDGFGVTSQGVIDRDRIARRICTDFLAERDKAELLTEVAIRQLPIIRAVDDKTVSVYVGIPFCRTRCLYCSFPSNVLPADSEVAEFMTVLNRDIEAAANSIARYGLKVQTIYIGGGTPSALPEKFFAELLAKVHDSFNGAGVEEFTVECGRPDTITAEKISAMKNFGVTRVSVNPQTMHQRTLDLIGRQHTVADVERAFHELRAASNWLINMDLIIGLPGERLANFAETLSKIIALKPDDVTIHTLAIKRGSKLQMRLADALNRLEDFDLPDDAEVRRMSEHAAKILRGEKFSPYYLYRQGYSSGQLENVGWCKRGAASVYNVQIMGERQTILGVGAAASTKVPDPVAKKILTAFNAKDLPIYLRDVERYIARRDEILSQVYSPVEVAEIQPPPIVESPVEAISSSPIVSTVRFSTAKVTSAEPSKFAEPVTAPLIEICRAVVNFSAVATVAPAKSFVLT